MEIDIKSEQDALPYEIYLIPISDGVGGIIWVWHDEPSPDDDYDQKESVKYIRAK